MVSCKQRLQHRCHDLPFLLAFPLPGLVTGVLIIIIIILRVISYQDTINVFVSSTRRRTATETHLCMGSTRSGRKKKQKNKSTRDIFFQRDLGPDSQWTSNGLATLLPPDYRRVRLSCFQVKKKTGVLILVSGGKKAALTGTLYFAMNHYWSTMFFFFTQSFDAAPTQ